MRAKLTDLMPQPGKVQMGEHFLEVHPLTLPQIAKLLAMYKDTLMVFFSQGASVDYTGLLLAAPQLVADIVAMSIRYEDERDSVVALPAVIQIEIMEACYKLSVPDEKKFQELLERVSNLIKRAGDQLGSKRGNNSETSSLSGSESDSVLVSHSRH